MFGILNVCCWSLTPTHAAHASGFPRSVLSVPTFGSTARGIPGSCSPSVSQWSPFHWGASKYNKYRLVQKWGIFQNSPFNIIYIYISILFLSENDTALPWDFRIFALQEMPEDYLPCGGLTPLLMALATGRLVYINEDTPIQ